MIHVESPKQFVFKTMELVSKYINVVGCKVDIETSIAFLYISNEQVNLKLKTLYCYISTLCAVLSHSVMSDSLRPYGLFPARFLCPWGFSRQEYWSGLPFPPPGHLPDPGIKPRSPASRVDSLPSEPPRKPKNTGVGSLSLFQGIFPTQELNQGLLHCRQILYQLSYQGSPKCIEIRSLSMLDM